MEGYYIVRGAQSGVVAGKITAKNGQEVEMTEVRKLWYWNGAAAVEQIALEGVKCPEDCKFTVTVDHMIITDAIQIIKATAAAEQIIREVAIWKR